MTTGDHTQPLDAVQRLRREKVQAARRMLADCKADVDRLGAEAEHISATIGQHESAARVAVQGLGEQSGLAVYVRLVEALESALAARRDQLAEARERFASAQQGLREALADLKAVQALQARRAAAGEARAAWRQTRDSDLLAALGHDRSAGRWEQG
jgi:flagellar biosynthesis chaperone FliJ